MARKRIFHRVPSDLTRTRNLHYKRARRTHNLKLSTLHEINSLKISEACSSLNFYVGGICCGTASHTHNWLAVRAKKPASTVRGALTTSNCLHCTKSTVLKLVKNAVHLTISMSAMSVVALPVTLTTGCKSKKIGSRQSSSCKFPFAQTN